MIENISTTQLSADCAEEILPGSFEPINHFYPRTLNANLHPLVAYFMRMGHEKVVSRYCHLRPQVDPDYLSSLLQSQPKFFRWAGADLFHVTTDKGVRHMVVVETNSCPSGNKSMPLLNDDNEQGGFASLVAQSFLPLLSRRGLPKGGLAVLYDKNRIETSGYAAAIADATNESVWLTPMPKTGEGPARFTADGLLEIKNNEGQWVPIRAAFRYVTQKPWNRIPVSTKTLIYNPVIACLAGGRNKLVAAKAYDLFNAELANYGLRIRSPETIQDVTKEEIPLWVQRFGGHAVVKVPYGNAGQGVFTITDDGELQAFLDGDWGYDRFIVQSLVGNHTWSSDSAEGRFYHVGTMPDKRKEIFASDIRIMLCSSSQGYQPLAIYARRAGKPLRRTLEPGTSWDVLGTNLSKKTDDGGWVTDADRLLLVDQRDFNRLGIGIDDLIEGYLQTVLASIAIDKLAATLLTQKGKLRRKLFRSLNDDPQLLAELVG